MFWEENKFAIFTVSGFVMLLLIIGFIMMIPTIKRNQEVRDTPEQKIWAQVIKKEVRRREVANGDVKDQLITFETSDGIKITFDIRHKKVFDSMSEGDSGMLTFKGFIDGERRLDRIFISFEKE